jgi:hypothetical protein
VLRRADPLLGPAGAAAVFAPQKGASAVTVPALEEGLARLAGVLRTATGRDAAALEWGGAAGGCAGGLYAAPGAVFMPGFDLLADLIGLDRYLAWPISSSSATAPWMRSRSRAGPRSPWPAGRPARDPRARCRRSRRSA